MNSLFTLENLPCEHFELDSLSRNIDNNWHTQGFN